MTQPKKPDQPYEDRVLSQMLAKAPDPKVGPKPAKKKFSSKRKRSP